MLYIFIDLSFDTEIILPDGNNDTEVTQLLCALIEYKYLKLIEFEFNEFIILLFNI